ncbi:MAG: tetratricopeptide repeat protein [Bryobacterales bacterium]|nr:tetratricopeptide repeat protein [Bryobacterales bacterium]
MNATNIAVWLFCLLAQAAIFIAFGEWCALRLCGWRPARHGAPEFSFCLGFAAYALIGSVALAVARSARSVPLAVALVAVALWLYGRRDTAQAPPAFAAYAAFRRTRAFRLSAVLLFVFAAAVTAARFPWLAELSTARGTAMGTLIFDDVRTIGFPLALAADGFPLRSPIAMQMELPYATAPFAWASGWMAWLPDIALPILLADVAAQTLFYGLTVLLAACAFVPVLPARVLLAATAFFGSSINLWDLGIKAEWPWVRFFFGYFRLNQMYTTIGWSPLTGNIWIPNHVLGFSAILLAAFCFLHLGNRRLALLFAVFCAASSLDMTVMGLAAMGLLTALPVLRHIAKGVKPSEWVWPVVRICMTSAAALVLVNLPSLIGRVDSPYDPVFPINTVPQFNAGMGGSHYGLYALLFLTVCLVWRPSPFRSVWIVPLITGFLFSWLFEYHSIWFWRFTFAGHFLFGMWFAVHFPAARQRLYAALWALILLAGVRQTYVNFEFGIRQGPWVTADKAAAMRWIETNTPLTAKVAEFRPEESNLVADPGFLRTGNRAGVRPYDRSHALVGFKEYKRRFAYLHVGIAANDYVLTPKAERDFIAVIEDCRAPRVFDNASLALFHIHAACRQRLQDESRRQSYIAWNDKLAMRQLLARNTDPSKLETGALREYVILHPGAMWLLRKRMEQLWEQGRAPEAAQILAPVVEAHPQLGEAHYSYAFSLTIAALDREKAILHFTKALEAGYPEFWVRYNRGSAYFALGKSAEARADLERACALDPKHADAARMLAAIVKGAPR